MVKQRNPYNSSYHLGRIRVNEAHVIGDGVDHVEPHYRGQGWEFVRSVVKRSVLIDNFEVPRAGARAVSR